MTTTSPTPTAAREVLHTLTVGEPFYAPDVDGAMSAGRRDRRRRRQLVAVLAAPVVAAVAVAGLALASAAGPAGVPGGTGGAGAGALPGAAHLSGLGAPYDAIRGAVVASSPAGLDVGALDQVGSTDGWSLDGNVDDGHGAARLYLVVMPSSQGTLEARPCSDVEFHGNGACSTRTLADGSTVTLAGPFGVDGYRTENVVLVRPDGSAVLVEADNAAMPADPGAARAQAIAQGKAYRMPITRPQPVYTTDQLATLAAAVAAAALPAAG